MELAAEIFDRLGARPWADRAHAELRVTAASINPPRGKSSKLSPQERRIAELAAIGQTSKQIAAQLSLSSRTVEVHLIRAFRKLGIKKRSALRLALLQQVSEPGPIIEEFAET